MLTRLHKVLRNEAGGDGDEAGGGGGETDGRPDWMPERFWNSEEAAQTGDAQDARIAAASRVMAGSFNELESKLKERKDSAIATYMEELKANVPESYALELGDDVVPEGVEMKLTDEDPLVQWYRDIAKERNLSQEDFTKDVAGFVKTMAEVVQQEHEEAMKALGENAQKRIDAVDAYMAANAPEEVYSAMTAMSDDLNIVKIGEWFMEKIAETGRHAAGDGVDKLTEGDLNRMMADDRYRDPTHPDYAQWHEKVRKGWDQLRGTGDFTT